MNLITLTFKGYKNSHWSIAESIAYFANGVAQGIGIFPDFFSDAYCKAASKRLVKKIVSVSEKLLAKIEQENLPIDTTELKKTIANPPKWKQDKLLGKYIDLNGIKVHAASVTGEFVDGSFPDSMLIYCFFQDNYSEEIVQLTEFIMADGVYGHTDEQIDVSVKKGDIVIDAGAYTGDFCAYASAKGATSYAFEPAIDSYKRLLKTAQLNGDTIIPVKMGLGDKNEEITLHGYGGGASFIKTGGVKKEKIQLTTIDNFVKENNLTRIDFIKADIEGAERNMLKGASKTLKEFAPKLSICTYHLSDDPKVLEKIIIEANPKYKVVQHKNKLFAEVV